MVYRKHPDFVGLAWSTKLRSSPMGVWVKKNEYCFSPLLLLYTTQDHLSRPPQPTEHSFAKRNESRTHSHSGRGPVHPVTGMGEAFLCVVQLRLVPSLQGSLYSKDTWKSRLPFLRMETVPIITDSCEVNRRGLGWRVCVHSGEGPSQGDLR